MGHTQPRENAKNTQNTKNQSKNKLALVKEKMQKHTELNPNQQLFVRLLICAYHRAKV